MKDILIDFGLPLFILVLCGGLLFAGRDSEVKAIFAMAAGWVFKSGYAKKKRVDA